MAISLEQLAKNPTRSGLFSADEPSGDGALFRNVGILVEKP